MSEQGYELIPPGVYPAVCIGADLGFTSGGKEQVALTFRLLDTPGFTGRQMTYYGTFTDGGQKHTIKALRTCGWRGEDLSDLSSALWDRSGLEVELVVEHDEYNGKLRDRVRWVNPPGGGASGPVLKQPMTDAQRKAFAARMRGTIAATKDDPEFNPRQPAPLNETPPPEDDAERLLSKTPF